MSACQAAPEVRGMGSNRRFDPEPTSPFGVRRKMNTGLRSASDLEGLTWSGSFCGNIADVVVVLDAVLPHMCLLLAGPAIVMSARSRDCRDDEAAKLHCSAGPKKISCHATVSA